MMQLHWRTICNFLTKLNILLAYGSAIILLDICPNKLKTYVYIKTCIWVFIAALANLGKTQDVLQ
jgi:hypothetical protein